MPRGDAMIGRLWRGWTTTENARFDERSAHHEVVEGPVLKAAC
jgi:hypothetical protein